MKTKVKTSEKLKYAFTLQQAKAKRQLFFHEATSSTNRQLFEIVAYSK